MSNEQLSGNAAKEAIMEGVRSVAIPVVSTLGPAGKTVAISQFFQLPTGHTRWMVHPTKDGATVAKHIEPKNGQMNVGAMILKQPALQTAIIAGDGTTTATALAWYMAEKGIKAVAEGRNPHLLKKGMLDALANVKNVMEERAIRVETLQDVYNIAHISSNSDDKIATHIKDAYSDQLYKGELNRDTFVLLTKSKDTKTHVEQVNGMRVAAKALPVFYNQPHKQKFYGENAIVVATTEEISEYRSIERVAKYAAENKRPLVIIASKFFGEAFGFLQTNAQQYSLCAVELDYFADRKSDTLRDIAILTNGEPLGTDFGRGIAKSTEQMWGTATSIEIGKDGAIIVNTNEKKDAYHSHILSLESALKDDQVGEEEKAWNEERLSNILGNIAILHVGANTEGEALELYDRYEDASLAVKSAIKGGYVAGGGTALAKISDCMVNIHKYDTDEFYGFSIVQQALSFPLENIYRNSTKIHKEKKRSFAFSEKIKSWFGKQFARPYVFDDSVSLVTQQVVNTHDINYGYNALNHEFCDMIEKGIIDPAIVPLTALENAVSASSTVITCDHIVVNV